MYEGNKIQDWEEWMKKHHIKLKPVEENKDISRSRNISCDEEKTK